jgi:serine/threonine protein phosphatase 1
LTRHLAIGDIHGCISALRSLIEVVDPRADDTIVMLGDYVDRGPDSCAVLDFIIELGERHHVVALRGNHEIMMLNAREMTSWFEPWMAYGGAATLKSYGDSFDDVPSSHIDFLENSLRSSYECETHFFVHANAHPDVPLADQSDAALYWQKFKDPQRHCSGKIMVCGHTPQQSGLPLDNGNAICIDTFVYGGGWLSCLDVVSGAVWQANEAGETRSVGPDSQN